MCIMKRNVTLDETQDLDATSSHHEPQYRIQGLKGAGIVPLFLRIHCNPLGYRNFAVCQRSWTLKRRNHFQDISIDGMKILKWILDANLNPLGPVVGSC
jgi:hypothetical protein